MYFTFEAEHSENRMKAAIANDGLNPVLKWFPKPTRKPKEQRDKFLNRKN